MTIGEGFLGFPIRDVELVPFDRPRHDGQTRLKDVEDEHAAALEGLSYMTDSPGGRRRPSIHITLPRASRLHRLISILGASPSTRDAVLSQLGIGLRTFYRELELLSRCGVKVRHKDKLYTLTTTVEQAEGRLPFPDPQLSFAEMADLARCDCESARRLGRLLASVTKPAEPASTKKPRAKKPNRPN